MIRPIALTFAAALVLAPIGAGATETAVLRGGIPSPPRASPGANAGVRAPLDQGAARPPRLAVRQLPVPRPVQRPPALSRNPKS